jgi:hypothetical protein
MPFSKCIFKDLLTNLNVRFWFFSKRDSWKPPTYQMKLTSFEKKLSHCATIPYWKYFDHLFVICFHFVTHSTSIVTEFYIIDFLSDMA